MKQKQDDYYMEQKTARRNKIKKDRTDTSNGVKQSRNKSQRKLLKQHMQEEELWEDWQHEEQSH